MSQRSKETIRQDIASLVKEFYQVDSASVSAGGEVPYAGRVYDEREIQAGVDAVLDFWLTLGPRGDAFEKSLASFVGTKHALLTNSGSSANLLAISALTSPLLERPLKLGDEVITAAAAFPTTVNPILQAGCVPVFVDAEVDTRNPAVASLERALSPKTRAVVLAHTLGNPFDLDGVMALCRERNLFLVEDNCDSLGSEWDGRRTGSFGHLATQSFYPPHHITMGEGGALLTSDPRLKRAAESFRDWGRDCWCASGRDNTCGKRFGWKLGNLPEGYDHKYTYSHIGYNLKPIEVQAAIGSEQIKKLPAFIEARRHNHAALLETFQEREGWFILPMVLQKANPSWFGFMVLVRESAPFTRGEITAFLEENRIQTRTLFGGNLTRQPAYRGVGYRVAEPLTGADAILERGFFIGVYPGIDGRRLDRVRETLNAFFARH